MALLEAVFADKPGMTPQDVERKRRLAEQLLKGNKKPITHWAQGLNALAEGLIGGVSERRAQKGEEAGQAYRNKVLGSALTGMMGGGAASTAPASLPASGVAQQMSATSPAVSSGGGMEPFRNAIASIESAGSGDYAAVGPTHPKLGRALGRYQVMEANIGPWSEKHLGRRVTPDEFLANPDLQDAIFDGEFGSYVQKYGPDGAAQAWFGGPGGVGKTDRRDSLGTTIGAYTDKFRNALGNAPAAAEVASLDPSIGMPGAAGEMAATAPGYVDPMVSAPNSLPSQMQTATAPNQQPMAPQLPPPRTIGTPPVPPQQQMLAQALTGGQQPQAPAGISPQIIQQLLSDPWTADIGEKLLGPMLEQQMQANDPLRLLQLERERLELEQMRNPQVKPIEVDGRLVNPQTGEIIADVSRPDPGYRVLTAEEKQAYGLPADGAFQVDGTGKIAAIGGGGVTVNNMGNIPPGYQLVPDPVTGAQRMEPIPGSPAARELEAANLAQENRNQGQQGRSGLIAQEIDRALDVMKTGVLPDTGIGAAISGIPGTDAKRVSGLLDTIKANIGFAELNKMRAESPTGGALGNVTERELQFLQSVAGNLDQSQDQQTLTDNLNRLWNAYQDVIHGEGQGPARRTLSFENDAPLRAAREAIERGADPEAVKQRLIDAGIDPSGL